MSGKLLEKKLQGHLLVIGEHSERNTLRIGLYARGNNQFYEFSSNK